MRRSVFVFSRTLSGQRRAEIGGRCGCEGSLGHSNTIVTARNSDEMFGSRWQARKALPHGGSGCPYKENGDQVYNRRLTLSIY